MASEFDKMFSDFEERKQREIIASDDKAAKHAAFRQKAINIINEKVAPVLQEICTDIQTRGHESQVNLLTGTHYHPSANLAFRITTDNRSTHISSSHISFATTSPQDGMEVRMDIWGAEGKQESYGGQIFKPLTAVTTKWIRTQTLLFIQSVLKAQ